MSENTKTAVDLLQSAMNSLKSNARLRDAPKGERSAPRAASILTAWTGKKWTADDVWRVLVAVKMAREIQGEYHADDYVDMAGYAALLGESLNLEKNREAIELLARQSLAAAREAIQSHIENDYLKQKERQVSAAHHWGHMGEGQL